MINFVSCMSSCQHWANMSFKSVTYPAKLSARRRTSVRSHLWGCSPGGRHVREVLHDFLEFGNVLDQELGVPVAGRLHRQHADDILPIGICSQFELHICTGLQGTIECISSAIPGLAGAGALQACSLASCMCLLSHVLSGVQYNFETLHLTSEEVGQLISC